MHDLLTLVQGLPTLWIYLVAALIVMGETAVIFGLLVPGEATLLLVGFLTYNGTLRLGPALLAMIVAAVLGDGLAFRAGRRYGPRLRARLGHRVGPARWSRADAMLARLGGGACSPRAGWPSPALWCPGWPGRPTCRTDGSRRGTWPAW